MHARAGVAREHRVHVRERVEGHAALRHECELVVGRVSMVRVGHECHASKLKRRAVLVPRVHSLREREERAAPQRPANELPRTDGGVLVCVHAEHVLAISRGKLVQRVAPPEAQPYIWLRHVTVSEEEAEGDFARRAGRHGRNLLGTGKEGTTASLCSPRTSRRLLDNDIIICRQGCQRLELSLCRAARRA